jgi:hypothetical protein
MNGGTSEPYSTVVLATRPSHARPMACSVRPAPMSTPPTRSESAPAMGATMIGTIGMGLFFAPMANVILSAVKPQEEGQASGASNAIRELGGVFGVAVLAAIFARSGSYASPRAFVDGMVPAVLVGSVFVALGAVAAFAIPRPRRASADGSSPVETASVDSDAMPALARLHRPTSPSKTDLPGLEAAGA